MYLENLKYDELKKLVCLYSTQYNEDFIPSKDGKTKKQLLLYFNNIVQKHNISIEINKLSIFEMNKSLLLEKCKSFPNFYPTKYKSKRDLLQFICENEPVYQPYSYIFHTEKQTLIDLCKKKDSQFSYSSLFLLYKFIVENQIVENIVITTTDTFSPFKVDHMFYSIEEKINSCFIKN
jgi:hypothetical protein